MEKKVYMLFTLITALISSTGWADVYIKRYGSRRGCEIQGTGSFIAECTPQARLTNNLANEGTFSFEIMNTSRYKIHVIAKQMDIILEADVLGSGFFRCKLIDNGFDLEAVMLQYDSTTIKIVSDSGITKKYKIRPRPLKNRTPQDTMFLTWDGQNLYPQSEPPRGWLSRPKPGFTASGLPLSRNVKSSEIEEIKESLEDWEMIGNNQDLEESWLDIGQS
ncbi:MAG TPA: hypothetical protein VEK38_04000 [Candidatus Bathyarchaeia archaeon]|nr:hypothetical protein [Candidatus Bathyarchaeia archaeon]